MRGKLQFRHSGILWQSKLLHPPGSPTANTESVALPKACLSPWLPHFCARCFGGDAKCCLPHALVSLPPGSLPPFPLLPQRRQSDFSDWWFGEESTGLSLPFNPLWASCQQRVRLLWCSSLPCFLGQLPMSALPRGAWTFFWGLACRSVWLSHKYTPSPGFHQEPRRHLTFVGLGLIS